MTSHSNGAPQITPQTTLAEFEAWAKSVRDWPSKPTSIAVKFLGASGSWQVTICMVGGPVIGTGPDLVSAILDALAKVPK